MQGLVSKPEYNGLVRTVLSEMPERRVILDSSKELNLKGDNQVTVEGEEQCWRICARVIKQLATASNFADIVCIANQVHEEMAEADVNTSTHVKQVLAFTYCQTPPTQGSDCATAGRG